MNNQAEAEGAPAKRARSEASGESSLVVLNVGGREFTTTAATLCAEPKSMLAALFSESSAFGEPMRDSHGRVYLDRDSDTFALVLQYLRQSCRLIGVALSAHELVRLRADAEFYCLDGLASQLCEFKGVLSDPVFPLAQAVRAGFTRDELVSMRVPIKQVHAAAPFERVSDMMMPGVSLAEIAECSDVKKSDFIGVHVELSGLKAWEDDDPDDGPLCKADRVMCLECGGILNKSAPSEAVAEGATYFCDICDPQQVNALDLATSASHNCRNAVSSPACDFDVCPCCARLSPGSVGTVEQVGIGPDHACDDRQWVLVRVELSEFAFFDDRPYFWYSPDALKIAHRAPIAPSETP